MSDDYYREAGKRCECGNMEFNIVYVPTPTTPADIDAINMRCTQCKKTSYLKIINITFPNGEVV